MFQQTFTLLFISTLSFTSAYRHLFQASNVQPNIASAPPGYTYGNYDQLCLPPPTTSSCSSISDIASDTNTPGFTNCDLPNSCCLCASITCGTDTIPCQTFSAGPNSAFGVQWIDIIGNNDNNNNIHTIIDCIGPNSCANTMIKAKHISKIQCIGVYACSNAMIIIDDPSIEFELTCEQMGSCDSLQIALNIGTETLCDSNNINEIILGSIECIGIESCLDLFAVVNNKGCDTVVIDSIECRDSACENAEFKFVGNVNIGMCDLTDNELHKTIGLKQKCLANLHALTCVGSKACYKQAVDVLYVSNGLDILCQGVYACSEAIINIHMVGGNMYVTENNIVINIYCVGTNSCKNAFIIIQNRIDTNIVVNYRCMTPEACTNAVFITSGIPISESIVCDNILFCDGCTYNGRTCHSDMVF